MSEPHGHSASMVPVAALAALEGAINAALALDPETLQRLTTLEGRVVAVEVSGTGLTLYLTPVAEGLRLMGRYGSEPDTTLRGGPLSLLRMFTGEPGEGMFAHGVQIAGDVELGQHFRRILAGLDIDWEEHLSRLTGDVVAHQVGRGVRGLFAWGRQALDALGRDTADYLQEERGDLPTRGEMEVLLDGIDAVRTDADRLEARVHRLRKLSGEDE